MDISFCHKAPYNSNFLFILSRSFSRFVKCSSIHRLQLDFVDYIIAPVGLICLTTLNTILLLKYYKIL